MSELPKINIEETETEIINFLKMKISEANSKGVVVGISGGIDSALSATLACKALGKENVLGVLLPSTTTPTEDKVQAIDLVKKLDINYIELPIDGILNEYLSIDSGNHSNKENVGNLKARIRMTILYYIAGMKNYLVCGTGNKSEIEIGYYTKFGDGACDMEPIGNLYKTQVKELAKSLNVPKEIQEKPPRAGLWNSQTDEEEIGMGYELLDQILYLLVDKNLSKKEIADILEIKPSEVERINQKVENNKHKNRVPDTPKTYKK